MFPTFHGIKLAANAWIANAVVENLASDPAPLGSGRIWYNQTDKALKFSSLDSGGAVIVEVMATGAQVAQVVTDLAALGTRVSAIEGSYIKKDGSVAFTGNVDLGGNKLTNMSNGTAASDGVNYGQLQAAIGGLANAFKYVTTVAGGENEEAALDLQSTSDQSAGAYYKVSTAGWFKVGAEGTPFYANTGDGLVFNTSAGVDKIDNTDSTVAGSPNFVEVTGSADTGYTVDIDDAFKGRVSTLETGLAAEISRAQGAEGDLQDAIDAEASTRSTADGVLQTAIDDEEARALAAEGVLNSAISSEASRATAAENALSGKIGDLTTLTTTDKTSLVGAVNELKSGGSAADGKIGVLANLTTDAKTTLVEAINEVDSHADAAAAAAADVASDLSDEVSRATAAEGQLTSDLAAEVARAKGVEGTLANLTTDAKGSLQAAINEVDAHADAAATAAASASSAVAAEQARAEGIEAGLRTDVDAATAAIAAETSRAQGVEGSLASLTTTAKGSLVAAVNEVNAAVAAEKARAEGAESDLADDISAEAAARAAADGDLSTLTTTAKGSLVAAINEVAEAAGEGTGALKDAINAKRFTQLAGAAALVHTITHNLNSAFVSAQVWVKGDDNIFRNDIVAIEETSANVLTVTLTESRIIKIAVQDVTAVA